jgi:hypothetical protein
VNYLHDKRDEGLDHNLAASFLIAPLLKQINQLRAQSAFVVVFFEQNE